MPLSDQEVAKLGYDAYSAAAGGKSLISGDPLPEFSATNPDVQAAWVEAAKVMRNVLEGDVSAPQTSPIAAQPTTTEGEPLNG